MNHTERIAEVARQRRRLTRNEVQEAVELYFEMLREEIASGEWVDAVHMKSQRPFVFI